MASTSLTTMNFTEPLKSPLRALAPQTQRLYSSRPLAIPSPNRYSLHSWLLHSPENPLSYSVLPIGIFGTDYAQRIASLECLADPLPELEP